MAPYSLYSALLFIHGVPHFNSIQGGPSVGPPWKEFDTSKNVQWQYAGPWVDYQKWLEANWRSGRTLWRAHATPHHHQCHLQQSTWSMSCNTAKEES